MSDIYIRMATANDASEIRQVYKPYVLDTAISFEYELPTVKEFETRINNTLRKYPYLVAVYQDKVVGYAYAGPFIGRAAYEWSAELSIYIKEDMKNKGIGGKLYAKLEAILKKMGILNLYACVGYPEVEDEYLTMNSVEFHKHLGFELVGRFYKCGYKFNRWYDMVWMEKIIGEHKSN